MRLRCAELTALKLTVNEMSIRPNFENTVIILWEDLVNFILVPRAAIVLARAS